MKRRPRLSRHVTVVRSHDPSAPLEFVHCTTAHYLLISFSVLSPCLVTTLFSTFSPSLYRIRTRLLLTRLIGISFALKIRHMIVCAQIICVCFFVTKI